MPTTVKTLYDLLFQVILNEEIPIKQILRMRSDTSTRNLSPQTFEGMWTIALALGVVPGYENITMMSGKVETRLERVERSNMLTFLKSQPLATSSKSGASDISFSMSDVEEEISGCTPPRPEDTKKSKRNLVFCSVKYFLSDDKKSVDQYDVTNIISAALAGKYAEDEFRVLILANDKNAVKAKFASAMRRYITYIVKKDTVDGGVLGRDDLEAAFTRLRDRVRGGQAAESYIQSTFFGEKGARAFLSLRFHQELVVRKTLDIMKDEKRKSVLWGVVARGGKTYITGGLIRDTGPKVVFIVAGAYTETHTQFLDELLDTKKQGMQDFADYEVVDVKNDNFTYDKSKKYIFFMSLELLKVTGTSARPRSVMTLVEKKEILPELVFFDEIHKGGTTALADRAVELIAHSAFKVFMTATYIKPFIKPEYNLDAGNLITWGYEDILTAKSMDSPDTVAYFEKKYGSDICQQVLQSQLERGVSTKDIALQYQKFPEIQFLTTAFSEEFENSMIRQNVVDAKTGFRMSTLLALGKDCMKIPFKRRWECLANPATVGLFLNYMGPANNQLTTLPSGVRVSTLASSNEHITDRIGRTSQRRGDRLKNIEKEFKPHSQLWFLPQASADGGTDKPLLSMMTCLSSLIMQHPWFNKNFCIVCVSSGFGKDDEDFIYDNGKAFVGFTNGGSNTKKTVLDYERRAYDQGRGLLILAGRMLTLGVSLPCVNIVGLLDDSASSDLTYQKMFRALTESEGKTVGYVVDVNPLRTLKTLYDYTAVEQQESSDGERIPVTVTTLTNMYLIDEDKMFVIGEDGSRLTSDALHKKLDSYLQASRKIYKTIFAEASANIAAIDLTEEFGLLRDTLGRSKPEAIGIVSDLVGLELPSGVERIPDGVAEPVAKPTKKSAQEELERLRSLREMVLTAMTLLAFLTTDVDLKDAFERYKKNEDRLQDIVYDTIVDRGLASEGTDKEKIKNVLVSAMGKSMVKLMEPYRKMRTQLSEFTGDQKEVIEFIETNLKPKKEQVAARGEVFTPLELVSEMLSHLPDDVWTHPEYKWLDPAGGLGQFPVIAYAKLDEGLKPAMPDDLARRKHIVENMLYIVELDNTNVELSRTLLQKMCGAPGCKLNLVKHDFLTVNTVDAFGLPKFKVIMGNPPYNPPKTETGSSGNSIWQNFVMKSENLLEDDGYLCFVHPPGWKKPTEDVYKPEKFASGNYKGQIRQGQVWQYMKGRGSFTYVYTNDQKSKAIEFFPNFPAVDYYVFQKDGDTVCDTRNIFNGNEYLSTEVRLNSSLPYLPCLITKDSINTVNALFLKEGQKPKFKAGFDPRGFKVREKGEVQYIYEASARGAMYQYFSEPHETVGLSKVVINYGGGVNGYYAKYIDSSDKIGVLHMTMYYPVSSSVEGLALERFYNSDIVKFLFLITQYSSGKMPKNEPLVANSITLPPGNITDYYEFFGIEKYKPFIEKVLADYAAFKAPKKKGADRSTTPHKKLGSVVTRRKLSK